MKNSTTDAVSEYLGYGWHLFPLSPWSKVPPKGSNGVLDASNREEELIAQLEANPRANIALACGASGVVALDIDPRHGGDESLRDLEETHGELPRTVTQLTANDGTHYLFKAPVGVEIAPTVGKLGPGLDVRAANSYIVLAPSRLARVAIAGRHHRAKPRSHRCRSG